MKIRLDLNLTDSEVMALVNCGASKGVLREQPRNPWGQRELKSYIHRVLRRIVSEVLDARR